MDEDVKSDLFDSKLSAEGKLYIRKFAFVVRIVLAFSILYSILSITYSLVIASKTNYEVYKDYPLLMFQGKMYPYFTIIFCMLFLGEIYFYSRLGKTLSDSVRSSDEWQFNRSFYYLFRSSLFALISLIFSTLVNLFNIYVTVKYDFY